MKLLRRWIAGLPVVRAIEHDAFMEGRNRCIAAVHLLAQKEPGIAKSYKPLIAAIVNVAGEGEAWRYSSSAIDQ
jgi:hypothetical protein